RLCASDGLPALRLDLWGRPDAAVAAVSAMAAAFRVQQSGVAAQAARQGNRHPLRHRTRDRRAHGLSRHRLGEGDRPLALRIALITPDNPALRRFRYASLTML